jgi:hypothetical protein
MFYKFENNEWLTALEIHFPDGTVLNSDNRIEKDGWKWYDEQPYEDEIIEL